MKKHCLFVGAFLFSTVVLGVAQAGLLGVTVAEPVISYINASSTATRYDATTQIFSVDATPSTIKFTPTESSLTIFSPRTMKIRVQVDNSGALVGGVAGSDLVISGVVGRIVGSVTNIYSGLLLEGEVTAFGSADSGTTVDNYDLRFAPTGGLLLSFFQCGDLGVRLTSEGSSFTGSFTTNFLGRAKGNVGLEDITPPAITCPATPLVVECNAQSGGSSGAFVTYPPLSVLDSCDPSPIVSFSPPSGSFFALPEGASTTNYVVVVTAVDVSGNTNTCSFTVTVQDTESPEFDDNENPIIEPCALAQLTFSNDAGQCYATITLTKPPATDCCSTSVIVTVTALDEHNNVITLTSLGGGLLQGAFPHGTNVVTTIADDGRGNTAQSQCPVIVKDTEAPQIDCQDIVVVATNCVTDIDDNDDDDCGVHHGDWHKRKCRRFTNWWGWGCHGDDDDGGIVRKAVVTLPPVSDNCDQEIDVTSNPPVGTLLGPGVHTVVVTAVDSSGNTNQCSYTVTVLAGLKVKFLPCLYDDNKPDNIETDADYRNIFKVCDRITYRVTLHDPCTGQDVTAAVRSSVTVILDVTERAGLYTDSVLVADIDENPSTPPDDGTLMYYSYGQYVYQLNTKNYEKATVNSSRFFRSDVRVYYNSNPDVIVGREDATLESSTYTSCYCY